MTTMHKRMMLVLACIVALVGAVLAVTTVTAQADGENGNEPPCVPQAAYTETTDWVLEPPGDGWYEVDKRGVIDVEDSYEQYMNGAWVTEFPPPGQGWYEIDRRTTEIVVEEAYWQRYSWTGGPHESDDPPAFPSSDWQPNVKGDPHDIGKEGPYYRSHGNSGKGDWFFLEWHDKVVKTVTEYKYERKFEGYGHAEFKYAFDHPAVTCPEDPEDPDDECKGRPVIGGPCAPVTETPEPEEPEIGTAVTVTRECVGDALVTKTYENGVTVSTDTKNGAARCAVGTVDGPKEAPREEGF